MSSRSEGERTTEAETVEESRQPERRYRIKTIFHPNTIRALERRLYGIPIKEVDKWENGYRRTIPRLEQRVTHYKRRAEEADQNLRRARQDLRETRRQLTQVTQGRDQLRGELDERNRLYQDLEIDNEGLERILILTEAELTQVGDQRDQYKQKLNQTKKERDKYLKQTGTLEEQIRGLKRQVEEVNKDFEGYAKSVRTTMGGTKKDIEKIYKTIDKMEQIVDP